MILTTEEYKAAQDELNRFIKEAAKAGTSSLVFGIICIVLGLAAGVYIANIEKCPDPQREVAVTKACVVLDKPVSAPTCSAIKSCTKAAKPPCNDDDVNKLKVNLNVQVKANDDDSAIIALKVSSGVAVILIEIAGILLLSAYKKSQNQIDGYRGELISLRDVDIAMKIGANVSPHDFDKTVDVNGVITTTRHKSQKTKIEEVIVELLLSRSGRQ